MDDPYRELIFALTAAVQRELDRREIARLRRALDRGNKGEGSPMKLPKLQAAMAEMQKLPDMIEADSQALLDDINAAHQHRQATFSRARKRVSDSRSELTEVNSFLDQLDSAVNGNGGPTLDGSSEPSDKQPETKQPGVAPNAQQPSANSASQPQGSWQGDKAPGQT